jgi:hypothetical protein
VKNLIKYILFVFVLVIAISANAQYKKPVQLRYTEYDLGKRLRFGFSLGFNTMDFKIKNGNSVEVSSNGNDTTQYFSDVSHLVPGFNVNAVSDFRLGDNIHLRFLPGYAFGQRNLNFFFPKDNLRYQLKIESSFIELPVSIKYSANRVSNVRPYLLVGGNYRIDLAASKKITFIREGSTVKEWMYLNKYDVYYELGYGFDLYLETFKLSIEFKYSVGLFNVLSNKHSDGATNLTESIDKMNSRLFIVAFHFE